MSETKLLLDTWAWWEILTATPEGAALRKSCLDRAGTKIITSAVTLGEISAKLAAEGHEGEIALVIAGIKKESEIMDVSAEIAVSAGILREKLRQADRGAGLADAIILATARLMGATLISADPAYRGQPDVRRR